jgi:glycosyltransferase involved in cell wall biosynthesis
VGEFCRGALGALGERTDLDVSAFAISWRGRRQLDGLVPPGVKVHQRTMPARQLHLAWQHLRFPSVEWFVGPTDVVHGTNFVVPPTRAAGRVVTVHDLTPVRYPQLCSPGSLRYPGLVRRAIETGAWVHTHSRFVADEVVAEFGADPDRVRFVHPGIPGSIDGVDRVAPQTLPPGTSRYVLAIGTAEPRKDLPGLVRAFDRLAPDHPEVALVLAGPAGWGSDALDRSIAGSRSSARIVRTGYLSDERLRRVLCDAAVLAFPSFYEGFGFPPLEAMAVGVPVVATSVGSVPEVVGDGAVLVAPADPDALAGAIATVLDDDHGRDALIERGLRRAEQFTWEKCAAGLARLYEDASSR